MAKVTVVAKPAAPVVERVFVKGEIVVYPKTATQEAQYYLVTSRAQDVNGQKRYNITQLNNGTAYTGQALTSAVLLDYPIQLENFSA